MAKLELHEWWPWRSHRKRKGRGREERGRGRGCWLWSGVRGAPWEEEPGAGGCRELSPCSCAPSILLLREVEEKEKREKRKKKKENGKNKRRKNGKNSHGEKQKSIYGVGLKIILCKRKEYA
jgi:hypothetical protein